MRSEIHRWVSFFKRGILLINSLASKESTAWPIPRPESYTSVPLTGEKGIAQRWSDYIDTKTGGNKDLIELYKKEGEFYFENNFCFTLIEFFGMNTDTDRIIGRETYWKNAFATKDHGYNENWNTKSKGILIKTIWQLCKRSKPIHYVHKSPKIAESHKEK